MRIDSISWKQNKRICVSVDDDLLNAFCKFNKKVPEFTINLIKRKIKNNEIKNSSDLKIFIYSQMMKPSAFQCFSGTIPDQIHLEDLC